MSKIFQEGSYRTLNGGFYEGTISLEEALTHGTVGIGTLDGANGEVIILDGIAYHGDAQNQVRFVDGKEKLPYVAVLEHQADKSFELKDLANDQALAEILGQLPSQSTAFSIALTGNFEKIEISSKPANNTEAYPEIMAKQPHFTRENIKGSIVGIWSPNHLSGLYGDGFHLHFISEDKDFGAHLVAFDVVEAQAEVGQITDMTQHFPTDNENFQKFNF
ncbi:acetolactate decarboxylase [Lactococcus termiticola]|uniref:Alpha-acetolactate decarboxylase n=1 Tax=Lactococcus termiticola TaxID=2169526 RepID=A0A2R5HGV1_9LACT|nr:acetolactate decarboxylase [Lactococcus termiticola]GBG97086.1 alpha-acetolactate decarboxylase [Lactococcus termiticola]